MFNAKLGTCLAAAAITLAGSTYLSTPAAATTALTPCTATELGLANAYADGYCAGKGFGDGTVTACSSDGSTITLSGSCA